MSDDGQHDFDYEAGTLQQQTCRRCKVTRLVEVRRRKWTFTWKFSDGSSQTGEKVPPCEPAPQEAAGG